MAHKNYIEKDGIKYYSVTTLIGIIRKPELEMWRGKVGNEMAKSILDASIDFGLSFHQYAQIINSGQGHEIDMSMIPDALQNKVKWYRDWWFENIEEVILSEENIFSKKFQYQGTPDLIAKLKGIKSLAVIDFKTGNNIYRDTDYQLSAYKEAVMEDKGIKVKDRIILHLPREGEKNQAITLDPNNHLADFNGFLYARSLYLNFHKK